MPFKLGNLSGDKIFLGNTEVTKAYIGTNEVYSSGSTYQLLGDIIVNTNTTQIDFNNLNITKDDELRLVYTIKPSSSSIGDIKLFVNNNTISSNYYSQRLYASDSTISASKSNESQLLQNTNNSRPASGFADIKISSNNRFVFQSQLNMFIGGFSNSLQQYNFNSVSTFSLSSITSLQVYAEVSNHIGVGSRLQLYKVNKGVA